MRGTFEWLFSYTHTQNCCRTEYEQNSLASVTQTTRITSICCINLNLILNTECEYLTWNGKYFFCLYAHTHFYFGLEIGVISSRQLRQCGGGEAEESAWQTKHNSKCLTSVSSNRLLCNRPFSHEFICQFCEFSSRFSCMLYTIHSHSNATEIFRHHTHAPNRCRIFNFAVFVEPLRFYVFYNTWRELISELRRI